MQPEQVQDLAAYNQWMNQRLYAACATLSDEVRKRDRGVFFQSLHGTLNHGLLADQVWMARFEGGRFHVTRLDEELHADFPGLCDARERMDARILRWAAGLDAATLAGELHYTSLVNPAPRRYEMWLAVTHFFNHQTHHRGQLTALLSQCGVDYGVTDLIQLPQVVQRHADPA